MKLQISSVPIAGRIFIVQYISLILIILVFIAGIVGQARISKDMPVNALHSEATQAIALGSDIPLPSPDKRETLLGLSQVLKTHDLRAEIVSSGGGVNEGLTLARMVKEVFLEEGVPSGAISVRWNSQVTQPDSLLSVRLFHQQGVIAEEKPND